jgi:transposase
MISWSSRWQRLGLGELLTLRFNLGKMSLANPGWRPSWERLGSSAGVSCMIDQGRRTVADRVESHNRRPPMSLHAPPGDVMPEQTIQVARAAFPRGNPDMRMRDALGPISTNPICAGLFSHTGRPAEAPAQLALMTVRPVAEGLSDAQAAEAVRARIDWQDALALELTDPGFEASVLSEFRQRLLTGHAELLRFETMLTRFREPGLRNATGRQRTDSTPVLAAIQTLNRLECVGETLRHALNVLATAAPDWLQAWVPAGWFDRYRQRLADYCLPPDRPARYALAEPLGTDGRPWLGAIDDPATPAWLREIPAIQT